MGFMGLSRIEFVYALILFSGTTRLIFKVGLKIGMLGSLGSWVELNEKLTGSRNPPRDCILFHSFLVLICNFWGES